MYDYYDYSYYSGIGIAGAIIIWVICLGAAVGLAFIPASMARKKGYSYGAFWVFGFFLFIPAIIVAAVIEDKTKQPYPPYQQPYGQPYAQPGQPPYGQPYAQPGQPPYGQPPYGQPYQQPSAQPAANCPSCGAPVNGNDAFCPSCGSRVK